MIVYNVGSAALHNMSQYLGTRAVLYSTGVSFFDDGEGTDEEVGVEVDPEE